MKVLLLSKYPRMGASSRLRSLQYLPALVDEGLEVTVSSLFDDEYLKGLYAEGRRSKVRSLVLYLKRFLALITVFRYELVWVEKEIFPYFPAVFERLLAVLGVKYVVDYDDAIFHNYDLAGSGLIRKLLGRKIDVVMANATCVIAGNEYLAIRARQAKARRVEIIPTVVDHTRYEHSVDTGSGHYVIGWIGSPSTQRYVVDIKDALKAVCDRMGARLVLVGATDDVVNQLSGISVEVVPWREDTEAANIARMDVGIMPLVDGPWEKGKCGYKLIQYMASGVPVVASPVGVNVGIVTESGAGYLASTPDEWKEALLALLQCEKRRRASGIAGRAAVHETYSMQAQIPRLVQILRAPGAI
ncbi:glycosyltransferase family 4 protein [Marinobacter sp. TBZ242]|uniref:Glycosyltransferase family 4 protein n=1 Tax=Marinobacter azerbaijanicus TaxID=3050455 RepID=A0ABT7IEA6_9GAMM|nr:glycosyltransferase family 4 protein [Marinobacter sp. TBZ242]MDL0431983.1 glycosyltransferase family 4 protein [Marinobacter sp. TBZ242]